MALIVQKYGGTSVGTTDRIKLIAEKIKKSCSSGDKLVVVVSAMSGETNRLVSLSDAINKNPSPREMDVLLSTGEQVTIALLSMALHDLSVRSKSFTGSQVKILTDSSHSKARIKAIDCETIFDELNDGGVAVVAGFQGVDDEGNITTLGRGGSDTTAVAIAAALQADECQIFTDVKGVYTTDPRIVSSAQLLERITFEEMLEMSSLGSKVLQIRAVEFAGKYQVPLRVLSSFEEGRGTLISVDDKNNMEAPLVSGIAFNKDEAQIIVRGVPDTPGVAHKILCPISDANIEVDVIVQNVAADGTTDLTFTVHRNEVVKAKEITELVANKLHARQVVVESDICKVSLVGVGMRSHAGIASQMFSALADKNINIELITTSEIKISVVVKEKYMDLAVKSLHTAFGLDAD
jgi:aspartate kinase